MNDVSLLCVGSGRTSRYKANTLQALAFARLMALLDAFAALSSRLAAIMVKHPG